MSDENVKLNPIMRTIEWFVSKLTLGTDSATPMLHKFIWFLITLAFLGILIPAAATGFMDIMLTLKQIVQSFLEYLGSVLAFFSPADVIEGESTVIEVLPDVPMGDVPTS